MDQEWRLEIRCSLKGERCKGTHNARSWSRRKSLEHSRNSKKPAVVKDWSTWGGVVEVKVEIQVKTTFSRTF